MRIPKIELLKLLEIRFINNPSLHPNLKWEEVLLKLDDNKLNIIDAMEASEGEVEIVAINGVIYAIDMFKESPSVRGNVCYDLDARVNRKKFPPESSAEERSRAMGSYLLDETLYLALQNIAELDLKTSVWLHTPTLIRQKGGAIFGDKRYGRTFIYHNGADSYYGVRGFRTFITL